MKKKYIVYTGSFNPVTTAHLHCMQTAMAAIGAEKGFFVPVCDDYLQKKMMKKMESLALSSKIRIAMLQTLCDKNNGLEVSDYEVKNKDSIHTYKTLNYFKDKYPEADIYFLNGADKLTSIPKWNNAEELVRDIRFVLFDRADLDADSIIRSIPLLNKYSDHFTILPATEEFSDVSSSKIREMFENGDSSYRTLMDKDVADVLAQVDLDEYPTPTVYDWIGMSLQGGPFDKARGYKKVYELNKELFENMDLTETVNGAKKLTVLPVKEKDFNSTDLIFDSSNDFHVVIKDLKSQGLSPVIISEAYFSRVCGGYDQGKADTLEEELCRISTLSPSLYQFGSPKLKCVKESGVAWKENAYPLSVGDGFYSPSVEFIRHGSMLDYWHMQDKVEKCDIISVASLDFTEQHKDNHIAEYMGDNGRMNEQGKSLFKSILCKAFDYAIATSHDTVIINAFGGGYHIPLADVGEIMSEVFALYDGKLKRIVVKEKNSKKYKEFYQALGVGI